MLQQVQLFTFHYSLTDCQYQDEDGLLELVRVLSYPIFTISRCFERNFDVTPPSILPSFY